MSEQDESPPNSEETERPEQKAPHSIDPDAMFGEIMEDLTPEKAEKMLEVIAMQYAGPIPPPAMLKQFDEVVPGAAKQIMDDAHAQSQHRRNIEKDQIDAAISDGRRGQYFAFIIAMTVIVGGIVLILLGYGTAGLVILLPALTTLIGLFIYSEYRGNQGGGEPSQPPMRSEEPQEGEADPQG